MRIRSLWKGVYGRPHLHTSLRNVNIASSYHHHYYPQVQGVFFRAHTVDAARSNGVVGWVANTTYGTVKGEIQGIEDKVRSMQSWLRHTGSPMSVIERCVISGERHVVALEYDSFDVKRGGRW